MRNAWWFLAWANCLQNSIGLFQSITIQGDGCKILNVQCSLGKLTNTPNAPWKKSRKISLWPIIILFCRLLWVEVWFSIQIAWKFSSKPIQPLKNSNLQTPPHETVFFQGRPGILHPTNCKDIKWFSPLRYIYLTNILRGRERCLLYYTENYWNKNSKPRTIKSLRTNQNFYSLKLLETLTKQPGSPLCLQLVRSDQD